VRDAGVGIAAADIDHPLPKHRCINERVPPEHVGDARIRTKERPNHLMRDERHLGGNDCRKVVIHDVQVQALQIGDVAWNMEGHDLASAAGKELVAAGETFEDRAALRRPVLVTDNICVCFKLPHVTATALLEAVRTAAEMMRDGCADRAEPADVSIIVRDGSPEPACTVKVALTIQ